MNPPTPDDPSTGRRLAKMTLRGLVIAGLGLLATFGPVVAQQEEAADVFVSPLGRDDWSGSLASPSSSDGPVATIGRAVEILRGKKYAANRKPGPLTVAIRGGTYHLDQPIILGPADAGTPQAPIIYKAYPGERPLISAGLRLSGWSVSPQGRWTLQLPDVLAKGWSFTHLYADGVRRSRPHLPKTGYYRIEREVAPSDAVRGHGFDRFGFKPGDLRQEWQNSPDIEILAFHNWSVSRLRPGRIDEASGEIWLKGKTRENWYKLPRGARYRVDNLREALSEPGEFYLDRQTGILTYLPRSGETPQTTEVIAPRFEHALILRAGASNLRFEGLTFAHSNWVTPAAGASFSFGATGMPATIVTTGVRNVTFDRIAVRNVAGYGVSFGPGTMFSRVVNSEFVDLGAGGMEIGTGASSATHAELLTFQGDKTTASNLVENNLFSGLGRLDPAGTGVWIANAQHNVVRNNDIRDTYYTGIQAGGTLSFGQSYTNNNFIFRNRITQLGQGVLSDMGGIYTMGISPGTVVSENVISDVRAFDYGGWGLYSDEGSSQIVYERNLVHDTSHESYFLHIGRDVTVRNNIFARAGATGAIGIDPGEHQNSLVFTGNIVDWRRSGTLFRGPWNKALLTSDRNVYGTRNSRPPDSADGTSWATWRGSLGRDANSLIADPLFVDAGANDFRLKPESPAIALGFPVFDPRQAGRTRTYDLLSGMPPATKTFD